MGLREVGEVTLDCLPGISLTMDYSAFHHGVMIATASVGLFPGQHFL